MKHSVYNDNSQFEQDPNSWHQTTEEEFWEHEIGNDALRGFAYRSDNSVSEFCFKTYVKPSPSGKTVFYHFMC